MPFDSSGVFTRLRGPDSWKGDATAGTPVRSDLHDTNDNDLANGLSATLLKDGRSVPTADIQMNGFKIINAGNPTNAQDVVTKSYADNGTNILTNIKTVDGAGSGLDADLLDGKQGAEYLTTNTVQTVTTTGRKQFESGGIGASVNGAALHVRNASGQSTGILFESTGVFASWLIMDGGGAFYHGAYSDGASNVYPFWSTRNMATGAASDISGGTGAVKAFSGSAIANGVYTGGQTWITSWSGTWLGVGTIGSWAMLATDQSNLGPGATVGGGNLWYANNAGTIHSNPGGSWQLCGYIGNAAGAPRTSIWHRYA